MKTPISLLEVISITGWRVSAKEDAILMRRCSAFTRHGTGVWLNYIYRPELDQVFL
jgi:hypothetical protein